MVEVAIEWGQKMLKNPYTYGVASVVGLVAYYEIKVQKMEWTERENLVIIKELATDLKVAENNLEIVIGVNISDEQTLVVLRDDIRRLTEINAITVESKDAEISDLRDVMTDMCKPTDYIDVGEHNVTIKIKEVHDENETIFNTINTIGS